MKKGLDYTGIAIVFFCHDGKGNVLMNKRGQNCRDEQGTWDCGGGSIEHGDTIEDTLRKEIAEEFCTDVLDYEFLGYRDVHREVDGQSSHWIAMDFKARIDPDKVQNGEPHKFEEIAWFPANDLPSPLHSQLPNFLELYKARLQGKD